MKRSIFLSLLFSASLTLLSEDFTVSGFRSLQDNRIAVRSSFGVRHARPLSDSKVELTIGMSITDAAQKASSYRIISDDDANYAYDKFVMPVKAVLETKTECEAPEGCKTVKFDVSTVVLDLPYPMKDGCHYDIVAQGTGSVMVTAAHSAQSFVFKKTASVPPYSDNSVDMAVLGLRQIEPAGNGVIKLEFGPNFSSKNCNIPENYKIALNGAPAKIINVGRISKIDTYLPVGWPFKAIPMNEMFIQIEPKIKDGDKIEVTVSPEITRAASSASIIFDSKKTNSNSIKVNQIGYLADSPVKAAYLGRWMGSFPELKDEIKSEAATTGVSADIFWDKLKDTKSQAEETASNGESHKKDALPEKSAKKDSIKAHMGPALAFESEPEFQIISENDGKIVWTGKSELIHISGQKDEGVHKIDHSGENVYLLDFTEFKTPGTYYISVPEVGRSLSFKVGNDAYKKAFEIQSYGVFAQRCGFELKAPFSDWKRIACHKNGVALTSQISGEAHNIGDLKNKVIRKKNTKASGSPELEKLDKDPSLEAYYQMNSNFNDSSAKGLNLNPISENPLFSDDSLIFPDNKVYGPTTNGSKNGACGTISLNTEKGISIAFWFKKKAGLKFSEFFSIGGKKYGETQFSLGASWGVPILHSGSIRNEIKISRIEEGGWHHISTILDDAGTNPRIAKIFVDGELMSSGESSPMPPVLAGPLEICSINGEEAGDAFFDEFRIYSRELQPSEIKTLSTMRPAEIPVVIEAFGGHHDAGDYNPRSHIDVAQTLMNAYEMAPRKFYDGQLNIPEKGNGIPDILDEAFWAIRLWISLQDEDGGVRNGTESDGDPNFIQTVELDPKGDFAYAKDSPGSYIFAGVMAQASRIWKANGKNAEAEEFLKRAVKAYEWAEKNPLKSKDASILARDFMSPKAYAAAQLLHTTGDRKYNDDFLSVCVWSKKPDADLEIYKLYDQSEAAWAYVRCPVENVNPKIQDAAKKAIIKKADTFIQYCSSMAYAFIRHPWAPINWGTGAYENQLHPVIWAYYITGDQKYKYWMVRTCDNTLGANPMNLSWIAGAGTRTVRAPLHNSRYSQKGEVVDGMQVEGPVQAGDGYNVKETAYPAIKDDFAVLNTFVDTHFAIGMNEGVIPAQAKSMALFGLMLPDRE